MAQDVEAESPAPRLIEELTLNGWPALQTLLHDGWLLRFAGGHTRRANSVNPLYPPSAGGRPLEQKVAYCEDLYARRGLDTVFKLTTATDPPELDSVLERRGYEREAVTSVQIARLGQPSSRTENASPSDSPLGAPLGGDAGAGVAVAESAGDEWLDALCRWGLPERHRATHAAMLRAIVPPAGFASLRLDGRIAAAGLAVLEGEYAGLFDIATDPALRGRGLGTRLVAALLGWARDRGARTAHLAVMRDNPPALRLYAKFGFRERYHYWYRVKRHPR